MWPRLQICSRLIIPRWPKPHYYNDLPMLQTAWWTSPTGYDQIPSHTIWTIVALIIVKVNRFNNPSVSEFVFCLLQSQDVVFRKTLYANTTIYMNCKYYQVELCTAIDGIRVSVVVTAWYGWCEYFSLNAVLGDPAVCDANLAFNISWYLRSSICYNEVFNTPVSVNAISLFLLSQKCTLYKMEWCIVSWCLF